MVLVDDVQIVQRHLLSGACADNIAGQHPKSAERNSETDDRVGSGMQKAEADR